MFSCTVTLPGSKFFELPATLIITRPLELDPNADATLFVAPCQRMSRTTRFVVYHCPKLLASLPARAECLWVMLRNFVLLSVGLAWRTRRTLPCEECYALMDEVEHVTSDDHQGIFWEEGASAW